MFNGKIYFNIDIKILIVVLYLFILSYLKSRYAFNRRG